jgi:hypothetical protein
VHERLRLEVTAGLRHQPFLDDVLLNNASLKWGLIALKQP